MDKSYKIQDGCHNCRHCFIKSDYDSEDEYFCEFNKKRPIPCGSCKMRECFEWGSEHDNIYWQQLNEWEKYEKDECVVQSGICDYYEKLIK